MANSGDAEPCAQDDYSAHLHTRVLFNAGRPLSCCSGCCPCLGLPCSRGCMPAPSLCVLQTGQGLLPGDAPVHPDAVQQGGCPCVLIMADRLQHKHVGWCWALGEAQMQREELMCHLEELVPKRNLPTCAGTELAALHSAA